MTTKTVPRPIRTGDLILEGLSIAEQTRISRAPMLTPEIFPADDLTPEIKSLRIEQARLLELLAAALDTHKQLEADFKAQDERHRQALLEAAMTGEQPPADERADEADRAAMRSEVADRVVAVERALVRHMTKITDTFRAHEVEWLGILRDRLSLVETKRAEARRLMAEAHAEEFGLAQIGLWVQRMANDDGLGLSAPPGPNAPPAAESVPIPPFAFERTPPDAESRPWLGGANDARLRAIQDHHDKVRKLTPAELEGWWA